MSKTNRWLFRNLLIGGTGFIAAMILVLVVLRLKNFLPSGYGQILLFIFPLPVACGMAVGLVAPRKTNAWAPLWSAVFILLLFALISGVICDSSIKSSIFVCTGVLLAALSGLIGQYANDLGYAGKSVAVILLLCCAVGFITCKLLALQMQSYERDSIPQVLLELNRDYINTPRDLDWKCMRSISDGCYKLSAELNGRKLIVMADANGPAVIGVRYFYPGNKQTIEATRSARAYLKKFGIQPSILGGLSSVPEGWSTTLNRTHLKLYADGRIIMRPVMVSGKKIRWRQDR